MTEELNNWTVFSDRAKEQKTGVSGLAMLSVPILVAIFGGKPSVGLLLHMLCIWAIFWIPAFAGMTFFELFLI